MTTSAYPATFYAEQRGGSAASAEVVVPVLMQLFAPQSVVDVGCGVGGWLAEFGRRGVVDVRGIDGSWVRVDDLLIPTAAFQVHDLEQPIETDRVFDLCLCLEVAEHLDESYADVLVDSLLRLAPIIAFSAAIPGQTGTHHINEQWQSYWARRFDARGYQVIDCIRPRVWGDARVQWWYSQNILVYVDRDLLRDRPDLTVLAAMAPQSILDVVHPRLFAQLAYSDAGSVSLPRRMVRRLRALGVR